MMTPTQFLLRAAQNTPVVITPTGKEVRLPKAELGFLVGECWLCGAATEHGFPRSKVIKPTFTDGPLAKNPASEVVCEACTWALSSRELRNYSLFATQNELRFPSRQEWREILLNPTKGPALYVIAVSGQKWLHFKARISLGKGYPLVVLLEEAPVIVPSTFKDLLSPIEELYTVFTKAEIENGYYQPHRILQFGLLRWQELEDQINSKRGSRLFDLALFVAQRDEGK